jgi:hypothetical protein
MKKYPERFSEANSGNLVSDWLTNEISPTETAFARLHPSGAGAHAKYITSGPESGSTLRNSADLDPDKHFLCLFIHYADFHYKNATYRSNELNDSLIMAPIEVSSCSEVYFSNARRLSVKCIDPRIALYLRYEVCNGVISPTVVVGLPVTKERRFYIYRPVSD